MSNPYTYDSVLARVRNVQQKRAADSEALNMKDPADKGTVTPPNHPDGDNDKKRMTPPSATNENGQEGKDLTDKDTHPSSTGQHVPGPVTPGKPKEDAATQPDTPISKIASDVTSIVNRIQNLQKAASAPTPPPASKPAPKAATSNANDDVANNIELTPSFHMKLASLILQDEEGLEFAERILRKAAGQERANELIQAALQQQDMYVKAANAYDQQLQYEAAAQAQQEQAFNQFMKSASAEDRQTIEKWATVHGSLINTFATDWEKLAYMQGANDAAAMGDSEAAGQAPQIEGGGEGPMSPEEIIQLLEQLVQSGELDPQTAQQIAQSLVSEEGGEAGGAGGAGGEQAPLPTDAPEEAKAASVLFNKIAGKK